MVAITSFKSRDGRRYPRISGPFNPSAPEGVRRYRYTGAAADQIVMTLRET